MACKGLHCRGCGGGGGGLVLLVLIGAGALIAVRAARVIGKAADTADILTIAVEVAAITVASAAAVAVAAGLTWTGVRVYRWQSARRARVVQQAGCIGCPPVIRAEVISPEPLAIEVPPPRLTGLPQDPAKSSLVTEGK